jgi:signal transduction histidine kinase/ActR/RegA family two-component response regulator
MRSVFPDFQQLFEASPGLYLVLTKSFEIIAVSNAYLNATKTERTKILGRSLLEVAPKSLGEKAKNRVSTLQLSLQRVLKNGRPDQMAIQKYSLKRSRSKGGQREERFWSQSNSPVFGRDGELQYIIHKVDDVTEFVRMKNRRLDAKKATKQFQDNTNMKQDKHREALENNLANERKNILTLKNELSERKKELYVTIEEMKKAKDLALRASEVKSQFLANMSHEIRTPLGVILGYTDLLLDPTLSNDDHRKYLVKIRKSSQHLLSLLSQILELSKIEAGHLIVDRKEVVLFELLEEAKQLLEPMALQRGITLNFSINSKLPKSIQSDRAKLHVILVNLISNAIKFCESGSVDIFVRPDFENHPTEIQFVVKDTGPGIPLPYVEQLFQPFTQADVTMTRPHGGSGLGLALSKKLAVALDGDVELLTTSPSGSTFRASFKIGKIEAQQILNKKINPSKISLDSSRVLLVDDSPDNLYLIQVFLERAGATVKTAVNGLDGVEKATSGEYDVVLMDIQMPKLNGYEATSLLRSKGYKKPIIALTAHALKEDQEKCFKSGCDAYLAKPIFAPLLVKTIQNTIASMSTKH